MANNLWRYEFTAETDTADAFFKKYIFENTSTEFDSKWLENLLPRNEADKLLGRLGAAVTEVIGVQSFGDFFGHEPSVAEQRSAVKHLDDIQLFLGQCLRFHFLCFRLVLFQKLRTEILQGRNSTGISSLLIVSVNTCRTTVDDRFLLCSEVCAADELFAKGHNEL